MALLGLTAFSNDCGNWYSIQAYLYDIQVFSYGRVVRCCLIGGL
jgi:hypothetical protein